MSSSSRPSFVKRRAGNDRRVVPAQAGYRLGQLLQPAHVGPAAVVNIRVGTEDDLDRILGRGRGNRAVEGSIHTGFCRTRVKAVSAIQPSCSALRQPVSKSPLIVCLPRLAHRIVRAHASARRAASGKHDARCGRHRADRSSAAQWKPCRRRPRVGPRLQIMRGRYVPVATCWPVSS